MNMDINYKHYYFAKRYGIKIKLSVGVTDFSIGFGKEIRFGWNDKSGTEFSIVGRNICVINHTTWRIC